MPSLTRAEAVDRAALVAVTSMEVDLDLDQGEETFGSRTTIRFTSREPGASTFVELRPVVIHSLELNGLPLDPAAVVEGRLSLDDLAAENVLITETTMAYCRDGQGLHRAEDPADGEHYVYGHLFLDAAPTVFACFDQPDLKAPYAVTVKAPAAWTVLGNGAATETGPGQWRLAETKPLATYFVTVCAGPYESVRDEHDGVPLGVHARASLADSLHQDAAHMLEVTKASFDYFHELFGIRYPFGEYHQVFVPEFNAGAMENPGCVTIRDQYVFRGRAARDEVLTRTNTICHEMAHMWFGNLVTMQWWDDLWLNESFAEYMAHRTSVDATEFTDAWVDSTMARKMWGYATERTPSTHPVAGSPAPDAKSALNNFDGISYAKGAAVLRQLIAYIGDDAFVAGIRAYLQDRSYGNGTFADFLGFMEQAAGQDLSAWSAAWLQTSGVDTISADKAAGTVVREAPEGSRVSRPHTLDIAGFTDGAEVFRLPATLTDATTAVPGLAEAPAALVVVPNASDLTWATVALDPDSAEALPKQLGQIPDDQARAVLWVALTDGVYLGHIDPRTAVETYASAARVEKSESIFSRTTTALLGRIIPCFLRAGEHAGAEAALAEAATVAMEASPPGSTRALVAARAVVRSTADEALLQGWVAGHGVPEGLEGDSDFRWLAVRQLAALGAMGSDDIDVVLRTDDTMAGRLAALTARAARPTAEAKAAAWEQLTTSHDLSNYEANALATGFWMTPDPDLVRPYVSRYFDEVPAMHEWVGEDAMARIASLAYPSKLVEPATEEASAAALQRTDYTPAVRRAIVDSDSQLREALRSLAIFG